MAALPLIGLSIVRLAMSGADGEAGAAEPARRSRLDSEFDTPSDKRDRSDARFCMSLTALIMPWTAPAASWA
jgi:hypothetical protein